MLPGGSSERIGLPVFLLLIMTPLFARADADATPANLAVRWKPIGPRGRSRFTASTRSRWAGLDRVAPVCRSIGFTLSYHRSIRGRPLRSRTRSDHWNVPH